VALPASFLDIAKSVSYFFVFIAPFFTMYGLSKRFETAEGEKRRTSGIFLTALGLVLLYEILFNIWFWFDLWGEYPFFGNEVLGVGAFFMYFFLLHMRGKVTGEDPWDRFFRFTAPYLMFYLIYCVMVMHIFYLGRLLSGAGSMGSLNVVWRNPILYALYNFGFPFAFYFIFLAYVECGNVMKRLGTEYRPTLISAMLILLSFLIWLYAQFSNFLFRGTTTWNELSTFSSSLAYPMNEWEYIEMLPGFFGSVIAILNALLLYKEIRRKVPRFGKARNEDEERLFRFVSDMSDVVGGVSMTLLGLSLDRYNTIRGADVVMDDAAHISNINEDEWPGLLSFVVRFYSECIGPITIRKATELGIAV
jgi:hypothetical protein